MKHPEKNEQQVLEQNIFYGLAQRLDLPTEDLVSLGLSPALLKINSLKNKEEMGITHLFFITCGLVYRPMRS